ncbi:MAG TPA: hypothetical protein VKV20_19795 [Ktedonobacteraceae bacterium]|jgi:hypothetical protein|nr:hypothetical protein [Ktedonobacteraceae bacterium]
MAYEMILHLSDQEYALLAAAATQHGKPPEKLLHELIQQLQTTPQGRPALTAQELAERLYREGKVLNLPERHPLTAEERAEREQLARAFAGGKPASEMVIEDRGPY